jgi:tetratricopeptide (TPR) repeat protein
MGLASVTRIQKNYKEAKDYLDKILTKWPKHITALAARGDIYQALGDNDLAIKDYRAALRLNQDFVPVLNNLAYLLAKVGGDSNLNEALPLIQRAKRLVPGDARILDTMGWVLSKRGAHLSALQELEEAAQLAPKNPTIQYHLALALVALERPAQAIDKLKKALSLPENFADKEDATRLLRKLEKGK